MQVGGRERRELHWYRDYLKIVSRTGVLVGVTTAESPARIVVWHRADG